MAIQSTDSAISPVMQRAIDAARSSDGKLHRSPGGYWSPGGHHATHGPPTTFGTTTVRALVDRGLATFTRHREGRNGRFAVEATLTSDAQP